MEYLLCRSTFLTRWPQLVTFISPNYAHHEPTSWVFLFPFLRWPFSCPILPNFGPMSECSCLDLPWRWPLINVSKVLLHATGDAMTQDHHCSDHQSHYVSPQQGIAPRLTVCRVSMLPTHWGDIFSCLIEAQGHTGMRPKFNDNQIATSPLVFKISLSIGLKDMGPPF